MSKLRTQLFWMIKGGHATEQALSSYGEAIRSLQDKVARIDEQLQALCATHDADRAAAAAIVSDIDVLRANLREAVDDLGDRVGHIAARLG